ncbi:DUF1543 domain-containing protein [Mucilaginibacter paludis]|uniref:DUF1543 domain-containing protein n=1 Tax=Mucilaginibacter paludis TaxID=423351 RepID=UPI00145E7785
MPEIEAFWPESEKIQHIDVWREVNLVDGYQVNISQNYCNQASAGAKGKTVLRKSRRISRK